MKLPPAPAKGTAARILPPEVVAYKVEWRYSYRCLFISPPHGDTYRRSGVPPDTTLDIKQMGAT